MCSLGQIKLDGHGAVFEPELKIELKGISSKCSISDFDLALSRLTFNCIRIVSYLVRHMMLCQLNRTFFH